jgi:segregation and condensation protein B
MALRRLAQLANLTDATEARTLLKSLSMRYDDRGCAFQVAQVGGGYQLLSRPEFATWLRPHSGREPSVRLSPPALETLAVVAYRQPVVRAEVEAIRGVACGEILRQLLDQDLLRIVGRSEELGRPLRYGTTKRFLQVFGLSSLDDLPWAAQLRPPLASFDQDSVSKSMDRGAGLTDNVDAA